jgi:hypothetical protein
MNYKKWKEGGRKRENATETGIKNKKQIYKKAKEGRKRKTQRKRKGEKGNSSS